jgi:hypothetical protein
MKGPHRSDSRCALVQRLEKRFGLPLFPLRGRRYSCLLSGLLRCVQDALFEVLELKLGSTCEHDWLPSLSDWRV